MVNLGAPENLQDVIRQAIEAVFDLGNIKWSLGT